MLRCHQGMGQLCARPKQNHDFDKAAAAALCVMKKAGNGALARSVRPSRRKTRKEGPEAAVPGLCLTPASAAGKEGCRGAGAGLHQVWAALVKL